MNTRKFHEIWIKQCDVTYEIKLRYGARAAFDYLVTEKLLNFADAASGHPEFAKELPKFVARVRGLFTLQEIRTNLVRIECEKNDLGTDRDNKEDEELADENARDDKLILDTPTAGLERAQRFATIKELLTAAELGTS